MFKVLVCLGLIILVNLVGLKMKKKLGDGKKLLRILIALMRFVLTFVLIIVGMVFYFTRDTGLKYYDSFDEFQSNVSYDFYLPDGAENLKMAINKKSLSKTFIMSFDLDSEELEDFIEIVVQEKYPNGNPEELEYDRYYNLSVSDIDSVRESYNLDDFPTNLIFDAVIDDSISDYTVIYYYPVNSGSHGYAILYNAETNKVVEYHYVAAR